MSEEIIKAGFGESPTIQWNEHGTLKERIAFIKNTSISDGKIRAEMLIPVLDELVQIMHTLDAETELRAELEDWCAVDLWKRNGELEAKIKELEAEKEELEGPHTIEHEWTHEQFNSMFEKLSMMAVRISDKEVKKITMTCESDSQEVKWSATCNKEQSK